MTPIALGQLVTLPDRTLLEALPCYVFLQRGERIVYANHAARQALNLVDETHLDIPSNKILLGAFPGLSNTAYSGHEGPNPTSGMEDEEDGHTSFECMLARADGSTVALRGSYSRLEGSEFEWLIAAQPIVSGESKFPRSTLLEDLLDCSPEAVVITHGTRVLHVNPEFTRIFGYRTNEAVGQEMHALVVPETRRHESEMLQHAVDHYGRAAIESVRQTESGELVDVSILMSAVVIGGRKVGYFCSYRDIREQKLIEAKLQHDALHDPLTGLANRALFLDRLTVTIARKLRRPEQSFAVMFLDLDRFKEINDKLGHACGDLVLLAVSKRLKVCFRPQDTVARFGGDEFAVLLESVTSPADVDAIVTRVEHEIAREIDAYGTNVSTTASIGIAFGTSEHATAEQALRDADFAMYRAKSGGGGRSEIYDSSMHITVANQLQKERDLRRALEDEEFEVWYQPVYRLEGGEIEGFEALLRWRRPDGSMMPLAEFLPLAEETGLIGPIGQYVLEEACRQAKTWFEGQPGSNLSMSVNLSPRQFSQSNLVETVAQALSKAQLPPSHLRLEISEAAVSQNADAAIAVFQRLMDIGVSIALDNFGAGLASMNYLIRLPIDVVKIDRRLISYLPSPGRHSALLGSLFDLGRALRVQMLAEGVETPGQLEALRRHGCELAQGFLFSPPVPGIDAAMLAKKKLPAEIYPGSE